MPLVEIKDFNALIDNKSFLICHQKTQETYEKFAKMSRNHGNLLDFSYH